MSIIIAFAIYFGISGLQIWEWTKQGGSLKTWILPDYLQFLSTPILLVICFIFPAAKGFALGIIFYEFWRLSVEYISTLIYKKRLIQIGRYHPDMPAHTLKMLAVATINLVLIWLV